MLVREGIAAIFKDGRQISELVRNRSYVVEISTPCQLGYISFWKNGMCDIEVIDMSNNAHVENASMLEATDETVPRLFERFLVAYGFEPTANAS